MGYLDFGGPRNSCSVRRADSKIHVILYTFILSLFHGKLCKLVLNFDVNSTWYNFGTQL